VLRRDRGRAAKKYNVSGARWIGGEGRAGGSDEAIPARREQSDGGSADWRLGLADRGLSLGAARCAGIKGGCSHARRGSPSRGAGLGGAARRSLRGFVAYYTARKTVAPHDLPPCGPP
jgi:hypothetical protein